MHRANHLSGFVMVTLNVETVSCFCSLSEEVLICWWEGFLYSLLSALISVLADSLVEAERIRILRMFIGLCILAWDWFPLCSFLCELFVSAL